MYIYIYIFENPRIDFTAAGFTEQLLNGRHIAYTSKTNLYTSNSSTNTTEVGEGKVQGIKIPVTPSKRKRVKTLGKDPAKKLGVRTRNHKEIKTSHLPHFGKNVLQPQHPFTATFSLSCAAEC